MKTNSVLAIAAFLLSAAASASTFTDCSYDKMLNYAVGNSLITEVYGESIVHQGGPMSGAPEEALLVADLVSSSGYREVQLIKCSPDGQLSTISRSIRQGKVVFTDEAK
jgi:hypothetical protein